MCHINVCVILNVKQKYQKLWTMFLCCYCFCCMVMEKIKSEIWVEGNNEAFTLIGWLRYMYKNIFKWSPLSFPRHDTHIYKHSVWLYLYYIVYTHVIWPLAPFLHYINALIFYFFLKDRRNTNFSTNFDQRFPFSFFSSQAINVVIMVCFCHLKASKPILDIVLKILDIVNVMTISLLCFILFL